MLETREELAFDTETLRRLVTVELRLDQLDRDTLLECGVGALGQIDRPHTAGAQALQQTVATETASSPWIDCRLVGRIVGRLRQLQEGGCLLPSSEQGVDLGAQCVVIAASTVDECRARLRRPPNGAKQDVVDRLGRHGDIRSPRLPKRTPSAPGIARCGRRASIALLSVLPETAPAQSP